MFFQTNCPLFWTIPSHHFLPSSPSARISPNLPKEITLNSIFGLFFQMFTNVSVAKSWKRCRAESRRNMLWFDGSGYRMYKTIIEGIVLTARGYDAIKTCNNSRSNLRSGLIVHKLLVYFIWLSFGKLQWYGCCNVVTINIYK